MKINFILLILALTTHAPSVATADQLKNESEVGAVVTNGNTQTQSISAKQQSSYVFDLNTIKLTGNFLRAANYGIESAYKWGLGLRYERELTDRFSVFAGQNVESDKFQNILQRYNSDVGGKYSFYKEDAFKWFAELGYRFTRTNYYNNTFINNNYLRLYSEAERFFNKSVSMKLWAEYLPNITVWQAYKINSELSLSAALNEIFAVKSGYLVRFDNEPAAGVAFKTDTTFTTALVAKF